MKSNAERQKAYRERKKAEKDKRSREEAGKVSGSPDMGAEGRCESCSPLDLQAPMPAAAETDLQAPIDPAPEFVTDQALEREWNALPPGKIVPYQPDSGLMERYRKELQPEPVLEEPLTYFDVYKRRHEGMFK